MIKELFFKKVPAKEADKNSFVKSASKYFREMLHYLLQVSKRLFVVVLFYFLQTYVARKMKVLHYVPNFNMIIIAAFTVLNGKRYAFLSAATIGIIIESSSRNVRLLDMVSYSTLGVIFAQFFADLSDYKREIQRLTLDDRESRRKQNENRRKYQSSIKKAENISSRRSELFLTLKAGIAKLKDIKNIHELSPNFRIVLNAVALHLAYELIMIVYILLKGAWLQWHHIERMLGSVVYTSLLAFFLLPVLRVLLGKKHKKRRFKKNGEMIEEYNTVDIDENIRNHTVIGNKPSAEEVLIFTQRVKKEQEKGKGLL